MNEKRIARTKQCKRMQLQQGNRISGSGTTRVEEGNGRNERYSDVDVSHGCSIVDRGS